MSTTTTLMGLKVPQLNDPSPGYVNDFATTLGLLDAHDHSSGKGTPVTQSGLAFTGALSMTSQDIRDIRSLKFTPTLLSSPSDAGSIFVYGDDLYWYTPSTLQVLRITNNGRVGNVITGDYASYPTAAIAYTNSIPGYVFTTGTGNPAKGVFGNVQVGGTGGPQVVNDVNGGIGLTDYLGAYVNVNLSATARLNSSYINWDGSQFNFKDTSNLLTKGNFGSVATSGGINAVGGILQGSRIVALRGVIKASVLTGTTTNPITAYVDGATPAFSQTTFTPAYAGSIAAITMRTYGATGTAGTINAQTSGLSVNATSGAAAFGAINSGFSITFTPGLYTFSAGTAFTLNLATTSWAQSTTGTTGVDATVWVYA